MAEADDFSRDTGIDFDVTVRQGDRIYDVCGIMYGRVDGDDRHGITLHARPIEASPKGRRIVDLPKEWRGGPVVIRQTRGFRAG